ncbi:hypothetical protein D8674_008275 [Pyrus ussuriensis x Pyrus communis]|uniref:Uncharacterized protein n=1 Tax=Pyrus ussuriensis x Pyrus communis TaxID=2448454 RepID=A0A5N5HSB4_9ROSA|nr:hypothetical protein D8674_008275 [Pyrus ussuriensis x Pyrus communis]
MNSPCMLFIILLGLGTGELERSLREIERGGLNSQEKELCLAILKAKFENSLSLKYENFNKQQGNDNSCAHSIQNNNFNKQGNNNSSSLATRRSHLNRAAGCLKIPHRHSQDGAIDLLALLALSIMFMPFCIVWFMPRPLKHKRREIIC